MQLETIIGLEIHVRLKTKSKMFCRCSNNGESQTANTNVCPICLAHPGTLPQLNHEAVKLGIKAALALNSNINYISEFSRKNYYYPDLPKGYQITQDDKAIAEDGFLPIYFENKWKKCQLERLHLEEDSAKNMHASDGQHSWIDYNRAGAPLVEIVTKPNFHFPAEAKLFLQELRLLLRTLNISDANMEAGQLRCDANISLRPVGDLEYYPKTEIKNLNSFKAVEKALIYEIQRQKELWEKDDAPKSSETRGWDDKKGETIPQRNKETLNDYRFFPEPDLPILELNDKLINEIKKEIKNLPWITRARLLEEYQFDNDTITQLLENQDLLNYIENVISELMDWMNSEDTKFEIHDLAKLTANWIINKLPPLLKQSEQSWKKMALSGENMAELLKMIKKGEINNQQGQQFLEKMILSKKNVDPSHLLDEIQAEKNSFNLEKIIEDVLNNNPNEVEKYLAGKTELIRFFLGQVMRLSKGQANPAETEKMLKDKLQN